MQKQQETSNNSNLKIFKSISNLIVSEEFKTAQAQYFDKNCHVFESEEENKHEYFTLFKQYQQLIDFTIESQLLQEFSDTEVSKFFDNFLQDRHLYDDYETIDTLTMFTDFQTFKKIMVDYNQRINLGKKEIEQEELNLKISSNVLDEFYKKPESEWQYLMKGKKKSDTQILVAPFYDTGLKVIKMEFELENIEIETVKQLIINPDLEKVKQNFKVIEEAKIVDVVSEIEKVVYIRLNLPMMQRREILTNSLYYKQDNQHILIQNSMDHPKQPHNPKYIRAITYKSHYFNEIQNTNRIKGVIIQFSDMKGSIPKIFLNLMITKSAKQGIDGFIKQCQDKQKEIDLQKQK